jgi:hypothetical protein
MVAAPGKLLTLNLALTIWGVRLHVQGTVEILDVLADLAERRAA